MSFNVCEGVRHIFASPRPELQCKLEGTQRLQDNCSQLCCEDCSPAKMRIDS
jgi:hypothetical protein